MKQPKKLTREQKQILSKNGIDATKYALILSDKNTFTVINKEKKEQILVFNY